MKQQPAAHAPSALPATKAAEPEAKAEVSLQPNPAPKVETKQPEVQHKPATAQPQPFAKAAQSAKAQPQEESEQPPLHDAIDLTESFLPAIAQTMQEVIKLQFQIADMMTHNWINMFQLSWFPPSPMND